MRLAGIVRGVCCGALAAALAGQCLAAAAPEFGPCRITFGGKPAPPPSASVCGFSLVAAAHGPQVAVMAPAGRLLAAAGQGETVEVAIAVRGLTGPFGVKARATIAQGDQAEATLSVGQPGKTQPAAVRGTVQLEATGQATGQEVVVRLIAAATAGAAAVEWHDLQLLWGGQSLAIPLTAAGGGKSTPLPPPVLPEMKPPIEEALIEWDWRMQDGIGTEKVPSTYAEAVGRTLARGDLLIRDLQKRGSALGDVPARWQELKRRHKDLSAAGAADEAAWEALWRQVHRLRRRIALANPLAKTGPLLFVKRVPSSFSHQLTQYYGMVARPGGGLFVLDRPGESMHCRQLAGGLPTGSYQHPEVSYDGSRVLFSYCQVETPPVGLRAERGIHYHLYEMAADGSHVRQLTEGPCDDFSPRYLPDGKIIFLSTRRGGFHRCGRGPCPVFTLTVAEADGSNPRVVSFHETHEWDPAVLHDGRVIYTRWDYVDRHAVHYQQLWSVRPDGSDVRIFYGNGTFSPVGVWEARPVPGSNRVMATAAAHHAMTAGSIILLDVTRGLDGPAPITRLTPDALFPESEAPVIRETGGRWHAPVGVTSPPPALPDAKRWPGHCYRSPYPLSEDYFLAAYSFDPLIGEPTANRPNMFGIYLVDRFGNKELLYRDLNIGSQWPAPLAARAKPAALPAVFEKQARGEGTFFLSDVYASWPPLERGTVRRLRIVQVLPKSTPHGNSPPVGVPHASPGKQVLGTVPVEPDGSACFTAPAGIPLAFQALDARGQAIQVMRSLTYLQPGERCSCVGCHEPRTTAPPPRRMARALGRPPSPIEPGPDGSRPLSYPILVQPVLDTKCVSCHSPKKPDGGVVLTGQPQGHYTVSYNALAPRVPYSAWGGKPGDFRKVNSEPVSVPGFFGARGSPLMKMLLEGHEKVELTPEEIERLATWMDANVLFYGTFDPEDQARQQRGERIAGPKIE